MGAEMLSADDPPQNVVLFSGHMIDAPDRTAPRFPPSREPIAASAIAAKLEEIGAGRGDLGICGGACGGDLLFAEACLEKGMQLEIYIPLDEPQLLAKSVNFAGGNWQNRYFTAKGEGEPAHRARRARPARRRRRPLRTQQSMDAEIGGPVWRRKNGIHLLVERTGRRRTGRSAAPHGRGARQYIANLLAGHQKAVGLRGAATGPCAS